VSGEYLAVPSNPNPRVKPCPAAPRLIGLPYTPARPSPRSRAGATAHPRGARLDGGELLDRGLRDLAGPDGLDDGGDLALPPSADARRLIEAGIAAALADGARPIALGGDHSVTYPILRAIAQAHAPLTILHIDAHPTSTTCSRRSVLARVPVPRIMEEGLATRLVQVGIRTMSGLQQPQTERFGSK